MLRTITSTFDGTFAVLSWLIVAGGLSILADKLFAPFNKVTYDFKSTPEIIGELILRIQILVICSRIATSVTTRLPLPFAALSKVPASSVPELGGGIFAPILFFLWQDNFLKVILYLASNRLHIF